MRDPNSENEQPWYLRRGALLAGVFLAVTSVVGVYVAFSSPPGAGDADGSAAAAGSSTPPTPTSPRSRPGTPTASSAAAAPDVSGPPASVSASMSAPSAGCAVRPGPAQIPVAAPSATWRLVGQVATPASATFGPTKIAGGIGNCFAHDPTGALFAAVNTMALSALPPSQVDPAAVVTQRAAPDAPGYRQALAAARAAAATGGGMPADASTAPKVAFLGFRYVDYTPGRAVIQVAVGLGNPLDASTYRPVLASVVMVWRSGDWRYVYPAGAPVTQPIINTNQYIAWSA